MARLSRTATTAAITVILLGPWGHAHAQGRGVLSPEVTADRRITLRLQAPNAKSVQVQGDFTAKAHDLTRDDKGVWSFTSEPLKPSSYQYWYVMDGLTMPDPVNTYVRPASGVYKSQVDVPGEGAEWMAFRDVPHERQVLLDELIAQRFRRRRLVVRPNLRHVCVGDPHHSLSSP